MMSFKTVPAEFSQFLPLSLSNVSTSTNVENVYGRISEDGLFLYMIQDISITVYSAETGRCYGSYCFSDTLENSSAKITAVAEFSSSHISYPCLLLAVSHDSKSLLCMFNISSCTVELAVFLPVEVTSLDVVSGNGGACMDTHNLNRKLRCMFGIVAIGTLTGDLYFLDLCLDEDFSCDEKLPNITRVFYIESFSQEKRHYAMEKTQHSFLLLNHENGSKTGFEYKSKYSDDTDHVTALKFVPSLTTLIAGFNQGCIQLWELKSLELHLALSDPVEQAVISFAFQEPENDPRNFCYLWAVKGHYEEMPNSTSVATMYSLTYVSRHYIEKFGALYTELQSCNKRFEIPLVSDMNATVDSEKLTFSRLISCQVVNQKDYHHLTISGTLNESESVPEDTSLCFLSWEVWPHLEHLSPTYHLAVFDLNQWYQAHMPCTYRCSPHELCPYLGFFSLEDFSKTILKEEILDFRTNPKSIKNFKSLLTSEEFFYPSSLGFQLLCFTDRGLTRKTYVGLQKNLLSKITDLGPQVLLNPKDVYCMLIRCGLATDNCGGNEKTPLVVQKETILQLALEHHLPSFFLKCFKEWRYSDSIHEYGNSKSLLSWAWKRVINIKNSIDKFCTPVFNCSGNDIDKTSLKYLYSFRKQLCLIDKIMSGYQKFVVPRTEQGVQELQCRREAATMISMYLQVLLWLRSVGVLPEVCEDDDTASIVYRVEHIKASYMHRRKQIKRLHSSISSVLLIDGLVQEADISSSWIEKGGSSDYPPPSIYAALSAYLLPDVSMQLKHSLLFYLLLDLQNTNDSGSLDKVLKKFAATFGLTESRRKLLKAFWCLDRQEGDHAIQKFLHPSVQMSDILPWQHTLIVKSFLFYRMPTHALKYINHSEYTEATFEDIKLHLSVLLSCEKITEAYVYQKNKQKEGYGTSLLQHFFAGCQSMQKMKELLNLPLNASESKFLVKFLSENSEAFAQESLVMYHLLKCNVSEASHTNDKLSSCLLQRDPHQNKIYERSADRTSLVDSLMTTVPFMEKCLVAELRNMPAVIPATQQEKCQPLSVSVKKKSSHEFVTHSSILQSLLKHVVKSNSATPEFLQKPSESNFDSLPFVHPPVTPECHNPLSFAKSGSVVAKRLLRSPSPSDYSSPAKRSRLLDNMSFKLTPSKRKSMASDVMSLLQTPPIHRRNSICGSTKNTPVAPPQSILKKAQEPKKLQLDHYTVPTPPNVSEDESVEDDMQVDDKLNEEEDDESRQIRFNLPITSEHIHVVSPQPKIISAQQAALTESPMKKDTPKTPAPPLKGLALLQEMSKNPLPKLTRSPLPSFAPRQTEHTENRKVNESSMLSLKTTDNVPSFLYQSDVECSGVSFSGKEKVSTLPPFESFSVPGDLQNVEFSNFLAPIQVPTTPVSNLGDTSQKEDSDKDEFYSPCAEIKNTSQLSTMAPVNLFPPNFQEGSTNPNNTASVSDTKEVIDVIDIDDDSSGTDDYPLYLEELTPADRNIRNLEQKIIETTQRMTSVHEQEDDDVIHVEDDCLQDSPKLPAQILADATSQQIFDVESSNKDESSTSCVESQEPSSGTVQNVSATVPEKEATKPASTFWFGNPAASKIPASTEPTKPRFVFGMPSSEPQKSLTPKSIGSGMKSLFGASEPIVHQKEVTEASSSDQDTALQKESSERTLQFDVPTVQSCDDHYSFDAKINTSAANTQRTQDKGIVQSDSSCLKQNIEKTAPQKEISDQTFVFQKPTTEISQEQTPKSKNQTFVFGKPASSVKHDFRFSIGTSAQKDRKPRFTFTEPKKTETTDKSSKETPLKSSFKQSVFSTASLKKPRPTFVFNLPPPETKAESKTDPKQTEDVVSEQLSSESQVAQQGDDATAMDAAGTYEEFSGALTKNDSGDSSEQAGNKKIINSPVYKEDVFQTPVSSVKSTVRGSKKKSTKKVPKSSLNTSTASTSSRKTSKPKSKIEFSFAEPTSPADSEILAALAKSPDPNPLPSYLFSPPLTRLRKRRQDESSLMSESSFARPVTPPQPVVDPILEGILLERSLQTKSSGRKAAGSGRKKAATSGRKTKSRADTSERSLLHASPIKEEKEVPSKKNTPPSPRHNMTLRQAKPKPTNLF